jgi:DNA polymerase III delta prime subunit
MRPCTVDFSPPKRQREGWLRWNSTLLIDEALAIADNATRDMKSAKRTLQAMKALDANALL